MTIGHLEPVREVSIDHNESPLVQKLASEMLISPSSFKRGSVRVRNLLVTVLLLTNWIRPCGIYNLKIEEWQKRNCKDNQVLCMVSDHITGASFGSEPLFLDTNTEKMMNLSTSNIGGPDHSMMRKVIM